VLTLSVGSAIMMHETGLGRLTTSPNEKTTDILDMPFPLCASELRHMWFPTARRPVSSAFVGHFQEMSKSPTATSVIVSAPSSSQVQLTSILSGLISAKFDCQSGFHDERLSLNR
jgi:hypothetical protein